MAEATKQLVTGKCHCGAINFQSTGPIFRQGVCDCHACQKATGTLGSPNVGVKPETFKIIKGIPAQYKAESNDGCEAGTWNFCANCGAPLFWKAPDGAEIAIFAGALDNTSLFIKKN